MTVLANWARKRWAEPLGVATVVVLVVVGAVAEAYPGHHYAGLHLRAHPPAWAFALLGLAAVSLFWRRTHPLAVYALTVAGVTAWAASGQVYGAALVMVLVAFFSLAVARGGWATPVGLGAAGALAIWLAGGLWGPWGWMGGPQLDLWIEMVAAGSVGALVAARRNWKLSERLRNEQLEAARREETRQQVTTERLRIARELHDVVAHSMAMINVQASAAAALLDADPRRAADSIQAIRRASKHGLRELRSILDVLRDVDEAGPAVALPDRHGFEALADAAGAAGVRISLDCRADLAAASAGTALAAYRIVQESLTNVIRHAEDASARVELTERDGWLCVEVSSVGRGPARPYPEGAGTGLTGMNERARALGGRLEAGPVADGGFRVRAELPMTPGLPGDAAALSPTASGS